MTGRDSFSNLFEAYNARVLEPYQVAQTFIPPRHYFRLLEARHSVVVGPRGSGKTTLLKMLQGAALEAWRHSRAEECRDRVRFTGVFIPADRAWTAQVESLGARGLDLESRRVFEEAAFTTHVLRALVRALEYRCHPPSTEGLTPHRRTVLSAENEVQFVRELARTWQLTPAVPSLAGLRRSLSSRMLEIHGVCAKERLLGEKDRTERIAAQAFLHLSFLTAVVAGIELFDDFSGERGAKWAFLFDELELAPDWISQMLTAALRSVDERLIFKLALVPFAGSSKHVNSTLGAMPRHDYDEIALWYAHKEDGYEFCESLVTEMLRRRSFGTKTPEAVFGDSARVKPLGRAQPRRSAATIERQMRSLASKDASFRSYLKANRLDLDRLSAVRGVRRKQTINKIRAIVAARDAFRESDRGRSRKRPEIYSGAETIYAASEGNPRWLIGMVTELLERSRDGQRVSRGQQSREITNTGNQFRALLRTIPAPKTGGDSRRRGLLSLLDEIGGAFQKKVILDAFDPDAPGSFVVDASANERLAASLGEALNAGALVYVPDANTEAGPISLRGKRFRLAYLLAPRYQLPLALLRPVALSTLLASARLSQDTLFCLPTTGIDD